MSIQSCYRIFYLCTVVLYGSCQPDDRSNLHKQDCEYIVKKWDKSTTPFTTKGLTPLKKPWWKKKIKIKKIEVPTWLCIAGAGVVGTGLLLGGIIYGVLSHVHTAEDLSSPETELSTTALAPYAEDAALSTHSRYNYSLATGSLALAGATWLANCTGLLGTPRTKYFSNAQEEENEHNVYDKYEELRHAIRSKDLCTVRYMINHDKVLVRGALAKEAFSVSVDSLKEVNEKEYSEKATVMDVFIAAEVDPRILVEITYDYIYHHYIQPFWQKYRLPGSRLIKLNKALFSTQDQKKKEFEELSEESSKDFPILTDVYVAGSLFKQKKYLHRVLKMLKNIVALRCISYQEVSASLYLAEKIDQYAHDYIKNHPKIKRKKRNSLVKRGAV